MYSVLSISAIVITVSEILTFQKCELQHICHSMRLFFALVFACCCTATLLKIIVIHPHNCTQAEYLMFKLFFPNG